MAEKQKGDMSVNEAGHKGGQRERELVEEGKQSEGTGTRSTTTTDRDDRAESDRADKER